MGMFGGDKDKKKKARGRGAAAEPQTDSERRQTRSRSRRIVTPGSKPGGARPSTERQANVRSGRARPAPAQEPVADLVMDEPVDELDLPIADEPIDVQSSGGDDGVLDLGDPIDLASEPAPAPEPVVAPPPVAPAPVAPASAPLTASEPEELEFAGSLKDAGSTTSSGTSHRGGDEPLFDFLINKAQILSTEQAGQVRAKAMADDLPIDVAAYQLELMTEDQLVNALTQECWVPHLKVDKYEIRKKALDTIAEADAQLYSVLPVDKLGSILNLAMVNPLDAEAIAALESKTGLDIKKVVATRSEIEDGIAKYYAGGEAKEGGLDITQDHDSRRVTQMLSRVGDNTAPTEPIEPAPELAATLPPPEPAAPLAPEPTIDLTPEPAAALPVVDAPLDEVVEDIDDLLSAGEEVAPTIVEPITIGADELEPDDDDDFGLEPIAPAAELDDVELAPAPANGGTGALEQAPGALELPPAATEAPVNPPTISVQQEHEPAAASDEPGIIPAMPTPPPAPVATPAEPSFVDLVPVTEEEFQHAITHGRQRVFEKWLGLQTRNRILNAVPVEGEFDGLLTSLYQNGQRISA